MCEKQGLLTDLLTDFHIVTPLKQDVNINISVPENVKKNFDLENCEKDAVEQKKESQEQFDVSNECKEDSKVEALQRKNSTEEVSTQQNKSVILRKRLRDSSSSSSVVDYGKNNSYSPKRKKRFQELETDPVILARRQKQILYGKNTVGYDRYLQAIPKKDRKKHHPRTPPKHYKYSRRAWDGIVKVWRQQLHFWDESDEGGDSERKLASPDDTSESEGQSLDDSLTADDGLSCLSTK